MIICGNVYIDFLVEKSDYNLFISICIIYYCILGINDYM